MERIYPTSQVIRNLTGNNYRTLKTLYAALDEQPLNHLYPYLNLNELLSFQIGARKIREKNPDYFNVHDFYSSFKEILEKNPLNQKTISFIHDLVDEKIEKLNPYSNKSLEERLMAIPEKYVNEIKPYLTSGAKRYVSEGEYFHLKKAYGGNENLKIMFFLPKYISGKDVRPKYVSEIVKILKTYPKELKVTNE